jgi:glutamate-1-semialdehyde 2,1-aminomutase
LTAQLAEGLRDATGSGAQVTHAPGLLTLFFSDRPVIDYADAKACDLDAHAAFCRAMLDRGVYPPASQFEAWFPSLAHEDDSLAQTIDAAEEAFREAI